MAPRSSPAPAPQIVNEVARLVKDIAAPSVSITCCILGIHSRSGTGAPFPHRRILPLPDVPRRSSAGPTGQPPDLAAFLVSVRISSRA